MQIQADGPLWRHECHRAADGFAGNPWHPSECAHGAIGAQLTLCELRKLVFFHILGGEVEAPHGFAELNCPRQLAWDGHGPLFGCQLKVCGDYGGLLPVDRAAHDEGDE
jgi:hypothetical protein